MQWHLSSQILFFAKNLVHKEAFGKFANSASDDRHDCSHLPHTNTNVVAIFSTIEEQIKFVNGDITV